MIREKKIFKSVNHVRLPEEIAKQIETLILENKLPIRSELPSERELAAQLGVSRNILREAMSQLKQKGLLETRSGSGTTIVSPKMENIQDSLNFLVKFNKHSFVELGEARILIEVELAGRAATRADYKSIQFLFDCCDKMKQNKDNIEVYVNADIQFHESIAKDADNDVLHTLLKSLRFAIFQNIQLLREKQPHMADSSTKYHYQIAQAIQDHNEVKARELMRKHLEEILSGLHKFDSTTKID